MSYQLFERTLNKENKKEFEEMLKGTDFKKNDFYLEEGIMISVLKDGVFYDKTVFFGMEMKENLEFQIKYWQKTYEEIKNMIAEKRYEKLFYRLPKTACLMAFRNLFDEIPKNQLFKIFIYVYQISEYGFEEVEEEVLEEMKNLNLEDYKELDGKYIYRGLGSKSNESGMSWTTNYQIAKWFATRFDQEGIVMKTKINKEAIVFWDKNGREEEVIVIPSMIDDYEEEVVKK